MSRKTKILFTHNTAMWYRIPFFKKIAEKYDLDLVFTHIDVISDIYDNEVNKEIEGLSGVNYTILKNTCGFARGLIKKATSNYDVIVGGSWDTPQELIETIIIHIIAKIKHKPFIIWREDWDWQKEGNIKERLLNKVVKYLTNHSEAIIVPGTLHKEYFHKKLSVREDKIHIMPNVSNIEGYDKTIKKSEDEKIILYVGRLIPRKGVNYLLDAFKKLEDKISNVSLIIIGSGSDENKLKQYTHENNIQNVEFKGKIENSDLKKYYQRSNLVVIPSINEGMGDPWVFVLNEAMYYSNPVIATTAVGAAPDMIRDNGYIVNQRDSEELYDAMYSIVSNESLEKSMSIRSKEIIDNEFQYKNMVDSFVKAVSSVKK